ncbi:hypothetical protein M8J76_008601 [Diaphorina citri]|nr:hypothetical protein M8J75_003302 [Diaphorina citri]KAI5745140.1 hypothetical protein M8J76_008601 [Diaphorina citri]KAI5752443.1 hypothetical protein M8J77_017068 [Diaphorina citri]
MFHQKVYLLVLSSFLCVTNCEPLLPKLYIGDKCSPGDLVFVKCNICTCGPQGHPNGVCARIWCQLVPSLTQYYTTTPEPGETTGRVVKIFVDDTNFDN